MVKPISKPFSMQFSKHWKSANILCSENTVEWRKKNIFPLHVNFHITSNCKNCCLIRRTFFATIWVPSTRIIDEIDLRALGLVWLNSHLFRRDRQIKICIDTFGWMNDEIDKTTRCLSVSPTSIRNVTEPCHTWYDLHFCFVYLKSITCCWLFIDPTRFYTLFIYFFFSPIFDLHKIDTTKGKLTLWRNCMPLNHFTSTKVLNQIQWIITMNHIISCT